MEDETGSHDSQNFIERRKPVHLETVADLEAMLNRAARHGAREALREIGLGDPKAGADVTELRDWLENMRGVKAGFKKTTVTILTGAFWLILIGGVIQYLREHTQ